jgi:hypothetical protein
VEIVWRTAGAGFAWEIWGLDEMGWERWGAIKIGEERAGDWGNFWGSGGVSGRKMVFGRWICGAWTLGIEFRGGAHGSWVAIRGRVFVVSDWLGRGERGVTRIA